MSLHPARKIRHILITAAFMAAVIVDSSPAARIAAGDTLPAITAKTASGDSFQRQPGSGRPALIAFLAGSQKSSKQAAADLLQMVPSVKDVWAQADVVIVSDDQALLKQFSETEGPFTVVNDADKQLWGQFHIIAAPTLIFADKTDNVAAVIPGYGYDFAQSVRFYLNQVLGIAQDMTAADIGKVKTVQNKTTSARLQRHLKMAEMLQEKGKTDAAMEQLEKARQIDPNDLQLAIHIGTFHCRANRPQQALAAVEQLKPQRPKDIAQVQLIIGWAKRLAKDFPAAEASLLKAAEADPASAQALFQLGQVYEATERADLALKTYKKALSILLGMK